MKVLLSRSDPPVLTPLSIVYCVQDVTAPGQLQDMVEVVVMLRAAVQAQGIAANLRHTIRSNIQPSYL